MITPATFTFKESEEADVTTLECFIAGYVFNPVLQQTCAVAFNAAGKLFEGPLMAFEVQTEQEKSLIATLK